MDFRDRQETLNPGLKKGCWGPRQFGGQAAIVCPTPFLDYKNPADQSRRFGRGKNCEQVGFCLMSVLDRVKFFGLIFAESIRLLIILFDCLQCFGCLYFLQCVRSLIANPFILVFKRLD